MILHVPESAIELWRWNTHDSLLEIKVFHFLQIFHMCPDKKQGVNTQHQTQDDIEGDIKTAAEIVLEPCESIAESYRESAHKQYKTDQDPFKIWDFFAVGQSFLLKRFHNILLHIAAQ